MEGVIRSVERMTYTNVHKLLEGDAELREAVCQPLVPRFELMQELALILNRKRVRRGSIDFDLLRTADRVRPVRRRHDRSHTGAPKHCAPPDRGIHAGRE